MIVVISCGNLKRKNTRCAAVNMYTGGYFKAMLEWARSVVPDDRIFILSAKYGLLSLYEPITTYNIRMGQPGSVSIQTVNYQAMTYKIIKEKAYLVCGQDYLDVLTKVFENHVRVLPKVGMGYQIQLLKRNKGRLPK